MALIDWDASYSVQVDEIDQQHQKLIAMINELNEAMKQRKGKEVLRQILDGLVDYTTSHFGTEEKYFFKLDYPEKASHQKEHSAFVQKIGGFKADFEKGKVTLSIDVMHFLSDWLRNHIKGTDKKYARFFNERGVF